MIQFPQPFFDFLPGGFLHFDVHRGIDLQALGVKRVLTIFFFHIPADVFRVDGNLFNVPVPAGFYIHLHIDGFGNFVVVDEPFRQHAVQYVNLALFGPLGEPERRIPAGSLGQTG